MTTQRKMFKKSSYYSICFFCVTEFYLLPFLVISNVKFSYISTPSYYANWGRFVKGSPLPKAIHFEGLYLPYPVDHLFQTRHKRQRSPEKLIRNTCGDSVCGRVGGLIHRLPPPLSPFIKALRLVRVRGENACESTGGLVTKSGPGNVFIRRKKYVGQRGNATCVSENNKKCGAR